MSPTELPDQLERVRRRGRQLRRRRRLLQSGGSAAAAALVAVTAAGLLGSAGPGPSDEVAAVAPTTTSPAPEPGPALGGDAAGGSVSSTSGTGSRSSADGGAPAAEDAGPATPSAGSGGGGAAGGEGSGPPPSGGPGGQPGHDGFLPTPGAGAAPPGPSSPGGHCHNSHDPDCGDVRWQPDPGTNAPLELRVTGPDVVRVGDEVTLAVHAEDADAPVDLSRCPTAWRWGDGVDQDSDDRNPLEPCPQQPERYGVWDTPPRQAGTDDRVLVHTYRQPGTYDVEVSASSSNGPYTSTATVVHRLIVVA